jgi:hypothetical protein
MHLGFILLLGVLGAPAAFLHQPHAGGKPALHNHFRGLSPPSSPLDPTDSPRFTRVTMANGTSLNDSFIWGSWALARPEWARASHASYALGYPGNFAMLDWNGIGEYACQGSLIADKLLFMGGGAERARVRGWLLTMPVTASGGVFEAQNSEWHVSRQGAWEGAAEALLMLRAGAAHGLAPAFSLAPERLLCASRDGGATFAPAGGGAAQPGLPAGACGSAPAALLAAFPLAGGGCAAAPQLFVDAPSAPFPGPSPGRDNGGRALLQALRVGAGGVTHVALALVARARGTGAWPANVSLVAAGSGAAVAAAALPAGGAPAGGWFSFDVRDARGAPQPAGLYLVVLTAASGGARPQDSWFTGASWLTNACPAAAPGGGASAATFGASPLWLRNATADPAAPRLVAAWVPTAGAAVALAARRAAAADAAGRALGASLADAAARLLAHVLALCSLTPTPAPGRYDAFVVPDPLFRGSLEDGVSSGCSYYDLLRIGFASSYLSLRALEAVEAFGELQAAGLAPSACAAAGGSAFGVDNARALEEGGAAPPCYGAGEVAAAAAALRAAIGARFSNASGAFVDWFGCAALGANGGDTTACALASVAGGAPPRGSPLTAVATGFLPTLALAAKLGVPAGGVDARATRAAFAAARDAARSRPFAGPGWFANALGGLEGAPGGARSLIVQQNWRLTDAQGFAVHDSGETGDWHLFSPAWLAAGGARGYGGYGAQAENGGRFFSTTALVWDAQGPYAGLLGDWARLVRSVTAVGEQLAAATGAAAPLLGNDPRFLSTPVADALVAQLCARVRTPPNFPNVSDAWGQHFCDFYQDLPWALPENGAALAAAARAFAGLRVRAGGWLEVNGAARAVAQGMAPWAADAPLPEGWPADAARVEVVGVAVGELPVNVSCAAGGGSLNCTVALAPWA